MAVASWLTLLGLAGCMGSPIKELTCTYTKGKGGIDAVKLGHKESYIINIKTGEYYQYDEFSERLTPFWMGPGLPGVTVQDQSAVVNGKWKSKSIYTPSPPDGPTVVTTIIDLQTLQATNELVSGFWPKSNYLHEGTCKWTRPKTTKIDIRNIRNN